MADVAAALRKTTERLARAVAAPGGETPFWTDFEWRIAKAAAAMQGVSSLLWHTEAWKSHTTWGRFLREQRDHCLARYTRTIQILANVNAEARKQDIPFIPLKGAALYASGVYTAGERPMADIDLLVRLVDLKQMAHILHGCGYERVSSNERHQVFASHSSHGSPKNRLGEHVDDPIKIELHWKVSEHLPIVDIDITRCVFPENPQAGTNAYASRAGLMMHLLLHAAGNMRARAIRNIQLHDIALLARRFQQCDWDRLFERRVNNRTVWWGMPPLMLVARYYPTVLPVYVTSRLHIECPSRLFKVASGQMLSDVSWSNIRIQAFPGIEWAQTPAEVVRFMYGRIWPSRNARFELRQAAADIPGESTVPWYGISHSARMLRWLVSRPPRVQTLLSVRAALAEDP